MRVNLKYPFQQVSALEVNAHSQLKCASYAHIEACAWCCLMKGGVKWGYREHESYSWYRKNE